MVFLILCLVIFATLSLSGALRDYEYSKKAADKTTAYYAADTKAVHILAEIDEVLAEIEADIEVSADSRDREAVYLERAAGELEQLEGVRTEKDADGRLVVSYQVPVDETQELQAALLLTGDSMKILRWKEVPSSSWEEQTTLPVLGNGGSIEEQNGSE